MQIPDHVPGLRILFIFWAVSAVIWSALEGNLLRLQLFAVLTAVTAAAFLFQRLMAGRRFAVGTGILAAVLWGLALGVGSALMALFLMAVKTGLHGHGPEFMAVDIANVLGHLPLWSLVGLLSGLGFGLLLLARSANSS
jgi:hypothetical protein